MPNPKVAGYLTTDTRTPTLTRWLLGELERLGDSAPNGAQERNLLSQLALLRNDLQHYQDHRAESDSERQSAYQQLCRRVNSSISTLITTLNSRHPSALVSVPTTEERLTATITDTIANARWVMTCSQCGQARRRGVDQPGLEEVDGACFCEKCVGRHTVRCAGCYTRHRTPAMLSVQDNTRGDTTPFCHACYIKAESTAQCTRCDAKYIGKPANGQGVSAAILKKLGGHVLCWRCAQNFQKAECGHVTDHVHKIVDMPNVEDDDRGREEVRTSSITCCQACVEKYEVDRDVDYWNSRVRQVEGKVHNEIRSKRSFGVELEFVHAKAMSPMPDAMKAVWTSKADASLPERYSVEMASTILYGDEGLKVIKDLCDYAATKKWSVDCRAGFHLHIGLTGEPMEGVKAVAVGYLDTYELWTSFVAPSRSNKCKYCRRNRVTTEALLAKTPGDCVSLLTQADDRRVWCNWHSYLQRSTVEIRVHHATKDYTKISNWVKAHARFVDWCLAVGDGKEVHRLLKKCGDWRRLFLFVAQEVWKDREMARWFRQRAQDLHKGCAKLPPSHRKLRKLGLDPKAMPPVEEDVLVGGVKCYLSQHAGKYRLASQPDMTPVRRHYLNVGGWGASHQLFDTPEQAWGFARARAQGASAGQVYLEQLNSRPSPSFREVMNDRIRRARDRMRVPVSPVVELVADLHAPTLPEGWISIGRHEPTEEDETVDEPDTF